MRLLMNKIFPVGVPAVGKDLVGREKEINDISNMLRAGQSVTLISPRRYGKTSLSLEILNRLKRECYTVYIDIFSVISKYDLAKQITEKTLENKKIKNFSKLLKERLSSLLKMVEFKQIIKDGSCQNFVVS